MPGATILYFSRVCQFVSSGDSVDHTHHNSLVSPGWYLSTKYVVNCAFKYYIQLKQNLRHVTSDGPISISNNLTNFEKVTKLTQS